MSTLSGPATGRLVRDDAAVAVKGVRGDGSVDAEALRPAEEDDDNDKASDVTALNICAAAAVAAGVE